MVNRPTTTPEPELVYAYKGEVAALHAEIERLRKVLFTIRDAPMSYSREWCARVANEALLRNDQ